jgi:hypothetical protein
MNISGMNITEGYIIRTARTFAYTQLLLNAALNYHDLVYTLHVR